MQSFERQGDSRRNVTANWRRSDGDTVADSQFRSSSASRRGGGNNRSFRSGNDGDNEPRGRGDWRSDDDRSRGGQWAGRSGDRNRQDWSQRRSREDFSRTADHVRNRWNDHWRGDRDHGHGDRHRDAPFHGDWWKNHGHSKHAYYGHGRRHRNYSFFNVGFWPSYYWWGRPNYWWDRPYYWWGWSTGPRVSAWFSFGWPRPYYWDYGPGGYIYCYNDAVYVNGRWFAPAPLYYEQTANLAQSAPALAPEQEAETDWLPLGVFAMVPAGEEDSNLLMQLAVTKDGVIGGTFYNEATDETFPIEGMVDKETQRAAWSYVDAEDKRVLVETGIYNLTKDQCTALVHFSPEQIEVWQLVRLEAPEEGAAAGQEAMPALEPAEVPALPPPATE